MKVKTAFDFDQLKRKLGKIFRRRRVSCTITVFKKGNQQYERISQFQEKVLDVAKRQINEHTDISFDYELLKRDRSYEYIQIYVVLSKNKPTQLEIDYNKPVNDQKYICPVMTYGISEECAALLVNDSYDEYIKFVEKVNERVRKGEINAENATAYIIGAYQKKGVLKINN